MRLSVRHMILGMFLALAVIVVLPIPGHTQTEEDILDELLLEDEFPIPPGELDEELIPEESPVGLEPELQPEEDVDEIFDEQLDEDFLAEDSPTNYNLTGDIMATLNYKFSDSEDVFNIKYHLSLVGKVDKDLSIIKKNAKITTEITGFLAKWPSGQCMLGVSIKDIPYEIIFNRVDDFEGRINISFKGNILEDWKSTCTFANDPNIKFETTGLPEKWFERIIQDIDPPISNITINISQDNSSTTKLNISNSVIKDPPLGEATVTAIGTIALEPITSKKPQRSNK
ncbi:hypothetical protein KKA47_02610 [bacterium]|nr:hypothetical protein [bacterium]